MSLNRLGILIVLIHALIASVHSAAHNALAITMSSWQNAYILIVIVVMPLVAAFLLWRRSRNGFIVLAISMAGSLVFGGYYHFILAGPDNVAYLAHHSWTFPFQITALLLAVSELAGVIVGLLGFRRLAQ